jgi:chorismate synthase
MLRWITAGESHGPALVAVLEGLPADVAVTTQEIGTALARRRLGYGRGARMAFEQDEVELLGGVRHGRTLGSPIAIRVGNTEWPKWERVMSADPVPEDELAALARNAPLTRPRPGHADLVGMQKYGFDDARPVLERASARETAARVALGAVAAAYLDQAFGVRLVAHTVSIGSAFVADDAALPGPDDVAALDADQLRAFDPDGSARMLAEVEAAKRDGDTLGGVVEVLAYGVPPGLGSHVHWDRRLDSRLAGALMGIQAIKGVEVGDGFTTAARRGSQAHDEIEHGPDGHLRRRSGRAGGTEGGMSTGDVLRVRAASSCATVVLPEPGGPTRTTTGPTTGLTTRSPRRAAWSRRCRRRRTGRSGRSRRRCRRRTSRPRRRPARAPPSPRRRRRRPAPRTRRTAG